MGTSAAETGLDEPSASEDRDLGVLGRQSQLSQEGPAKAWQAMGGDSALRAAKLSAGAQASPRHSQLLASAVWQASEGPWAALF